MQSLQSRRVGEDTAAGLGLFRWYGETRGIAVARLVKRCVGVRQKESQTEKKMGLLHDGNTTQVWRVRTS